MSLGSHKKGIIPSDSFGNEIGHEVIIEPSKGSLAILHGHLWHKVLPIHDNIRVSTNYRCIPSGTPSSTWYAAIICRDSYVVVYWENLVP